jgi:hypothetical protein
MGNLKGNNEIEKTNSDDSIVGDNISAATRRDCHDFRLLAHRLRISFHHCQRLLKNQLAQRFAIATRLSHQNYVT